MQGTAGREAEERVVHGSLIVSLPDGYYLLRQVDGFAVRCFREIACSGSSNSCSRLSIAFERGAKRVETVSLRIAGDELARTAAAEIGEALERFVAGGRPC